VQRYYYQQLVPKEKYTPRDMAFLHVYINECMAYYQQLVPQGYTPRDMAFLHVYQNGIYTVQH
jgi:hypothetical protein